MVKYEEDGGRASPAHAQVDDEPTERSTSSQYANGVKDTPGKNHDSGVGTPSKADSDDDEQEVMS